MLCVGQPLEVPGAKEIPSGGATDKVAGSAYNLCPCESQLPVHMRKPDFERWLRIKMTPKLPPDGTLFGSPRTNLQMQLWNCRCCARSNHSHLRSAGCAV